MDMCIYKKTDASLRPRLVPVSPELAHSFPVKLIRKRLPFDDGNDSVKKVKSFKNVSMFGLL